MTSTDVLTAFYQHGENNAATVGIIKLAIAQFGINKVFKTMASDGRGNYKVVLRNDDFVTISSAELAELYQRSGFTLNAGAEPETAKGILKYANFCFAVMVKYVMKVEGRDLPDALFEVNNSGINSHFAYRNLGFPEDSIGFMLINNAGTRNPKDYQHTPLYLLYNHNHCAMAAFDVYDERGKPTSIHEFVENHSTWLKPAHVCHAYQFV